ncbi:hypothetical protein ACFQY8_07585 [Alloscardovia venturai]|uniref:Transcriptional regulator n=1 Tax=Alloscardovia venturai TaxID=1769421 RepID=A0ABW2YBW5_9BIFI
MTEHFLSSSEAAEYLGISRGAFNTLNLPEPDVTVGQVKGWSKTTIDQWNARRPGHGGRPRKER